MKRIWLTAAKFALVDDADYEWLNQWKWCAMSVKRNFYAVRRSPRKEGKQYTILMHRLILGLINSDGKQADHIDGNGLNNQRRNLRIATNQENHFNSAKHKHSSSKFKGVSWDVKRRKWETQIMLNGKRIFLGYFQDEIEAAKAYDKAAIKYFGQFARPNLSEVEYA